MFSRFCCLLRHELLVMNKVLFVGRHVFFSMLFNFFTLSFIYKDSEIVPEYTLFSAAKYKRVPNM